MHYYMVQKAFINTQHWTVTIRRGKYYGMCVLRLYTIERNSLRVNTSYFIAAYFYVLTWRSLPLKTIYNKNVFTNLN
jgi:hypothetical protein